MSFVRMGPRSATSVAGLQIYYYYILVCKPLVGRSHPGLCEVCDLANFQVDIYCTLHAPILTEVVIRQPCGPTALHY